MRMGLVRPKDFREIEGVKPGKREVKGSSPENVK
jgi:hypothetical protein